MSEKKIVGPDPIASSITDLTGEAEPSERLEMLNAFANENYSTKDIELKTELNVAQIAAYSKGLLFGNRYKNKVIPDLIRNIMKLSVSKNRAGRKEYASIAQSMLNGIPQSEPRQGNMSELLFGKR
jgi:hypothetical protein